MRTLIICDEAGWSARQAVVEDVRLDVVWYCAAFDDDDGSVTCRQLHTVALLSVCCTEDCTKGPVLVLC